MPGFRSTPIKAPRTRSFLPLALTTILVASVALAVVSAPAGGATPTGSTKKANPSAGDRPALSVVDIASAGPLTHVYIGNDLSCQVAHVQDSVLEYYPPTAAPGDCGTFLVTGGHLYAPDFSAHNGTATGSLGSYTPFTPVSQTGVTGSGTSNDPYQVVTVGAAGATGLQVTQTDSYVVGQESYQTDLQITNSTGAAKTAIVYRAADCYLGGSDLGFGFVDPVSGSVACQAQDGRVEEWIPITSGSHYLETFYDSLW